MVEDLEKLRKANQLLEFKAHQNERFLSQSQKENESLRTIIQKLKEEKDILAKKVGLRTKR
jgi:hypothetical protein